MLRKALLFICIATASFAAEPLSFVRDIQPILTKTGCNAGACHAKAITGQRGFRLSVLGFEPEEDYEAIVKQGKGRRVFPPAPEESLLITKGAAIVPHTGGKKIEPGSEHYQTLEKSSGTEFDQEFLAEIVRGHKKCVSNFEEASTDAKDSDLKAWATGMLPTLKTHLGKAMELSAK